MRASSLARTPEPIATARITLRLVLCLAMLCLLNLVGCDAPLPQIGDACTEFQDCADGDRLSCKDNTCQQIACTATAQCPFGAACVQAFCTVAECLNDEECAQGLVCAGGTCKAPDCEDNTDCEQGKVCRGVPKSCQTPPAFCQTAQDCPTGLSCRPSTNRCESTCEGDSDCTTDQYCDGTFCRGRCMGDMDCVGVELCINNKCQDAPDCSNEPPCPVERPVRDVRSCICIDCLEDSDCNLARNEACIEQQCVYCPLRATSETQCLLQNLQQRGECCVGCVLNDHCDVENGEVCQRGRCIDQSERTCLTDDECSVDEVCDGSRCAPEASLKSCQRQSDCPEGEACYGNQRCRAISDRCDGQCSAPNRCVAEPGDTQGTCAGCTESCTAQGCPNDSFCFVPEGQQEGYCAAGLFRPTLCP